MLALTELNHRFVKLTLQTANSQHRKAMLQVVLFLGKGEKVMFAILDMF